MNLVPSAAECSYAACFCEENVWKLCDHVRTTSPNELSKAFVVFISNKKQVSRHDDISSSLSRRFGFNFYSFTFEVFKDILWPFSLGLMIIFFQRKT